jgi:hypothetical protein
VSTRLVVAVVFAALVVAGAAVAPFVFSDDAGQGVMGDLGRDEPSGDLGEVDVYEDLPTTHVEGEVDYEQGPPLGGEHAQEWLECGVYDQPVREENVVHSLEHGTIWVTYDPSLDEVEVSMLEEALPEFGILSPYEGQDAPVVVTTWERQLALEGADDERLGLFVEEYGDGSTAPEPGVGCFGGVVEYDAAGTAA